MFTRKKKRILLTLFDDCVDTDVNNPYEHLNSKLKDILMYINLIFYDIDQFYTIMDFCEELINDYDQILKDNDFPPILKSEYIFVYNLLKYTYQRYSNRLVEFNNIYNLVYDDIDNFFDFL